MEKPWNGKCPVCKNDKAYQSFFSWQCPNVNCKHYDVSQLDLVLEYELTQEQLQKDALDALGVPEVPEQSEEDIPFEERDTIPYYPTGHGGVACTPAVNDDDDDIDDDYAWPLDAPIYLKE